MTEKGGRNVYYVILNEVKNPYVKEKGEILHYTQNDKGKTNDNVVEILRYTQNDRKSTHND